jgi:hypothetical protein
MIDDKKCREVLQRKIEQIKQTKPRAAVKEISQVMADRFNVDHGRTMDIFNYREPIESMPYDMLYKLMESIKKVSIDRWNELNPEDLDVRSYFTVLEIEKYKVPLEEKDKDFDIVIKSGNWHHTNIYPYNYYTIHTDINEVVRWRDYNKLGFNPETQRDLIVVETNGIPVKKLDIKLKSIKQMKKAMIEGTYFPVQGIININPEHNESDITIINGDLIIKNDIKLDLVEGFHNYLSETQVKDDNPDWNFPCEFRLIFMNTSRTNGVIKQMDIKNHLAETQTSSMDENDDYTYVITQLNTSSGFYLKGSIDKKMFVYLYKIIKRLFEIDGNREKIAFINNIKDKINKIIIRTDHYDKALSKEEWFSYLYIIQKTNDDSFDRIINNDKLYETISGISFMDTPSKKHYKLLDVLLKEVI